MTPMMHKSPQKQSSFLLRYSFAHFGKSLVWIGSEVMFLYYFTVFCGLSPIFAGLIFASSILLNAFTDVVVGYVLSKRSFDLRAATKIQWISAILSSTLYLALLTTSFIEDLSTRTISIVCLLIIFKIIFSIYDLAQNSILVINPLHQNSRTNIVGLRLFFSGLAGVIVSLIAAAGANLDKLQAQQLYSGSAVCIAFISIVTAYSLSKFHHFQKDIVHLPALHTGIINSHSKSLFLLLFLSANFLFSVGNSFFNKIEPYFINFALQDTGARWSFMSSVSISIMISQLLWTKLLKTDDAVLSALPLSFIILSLAVSFYYYIDFTASNILIYGILLGTGFGGICSISWNLIISITKNYTQKTILIGLYTFFNKVGHATSALIIGIILNTQHYSDISAWDVNSLNYNLIGLIPLLSITVYVLIYLKRKQFHWLTK